MKISNKLSARINLSLYTLLLIITPFLMLQNYLQDAIGKLSRFSVSISENDFPVMIVLAFIVFIGGILLLIKNFTKNRLIGIVLFLSFLILSYNTTDYYFNHHFYDIQHNWHYIAYSIFSWLAWRHFSVKTWSAGKIVFRTFLLAFAISLFDEMIQVFISNRVFDLSDVSKDLWGCMLGQIFIHFVLFDCKYVNFKNFWPAKNKLLMQHPAYIMTLEMIFTYVFLFVSSLLSDSEYAAEVFLFSILFFLILYFLFKRASHKKGRVILSGLCVLIISFVVFSFLFSQPRVKYISKNLILYKGIPAPYFDVMIFPDGLMRPVDKKTHFNIRDQAKINSIGADILIIATGSKGQGGTGFNDQKKVEIKYNPIKQKIYQIIKLPGEDAYKVYNRLAKEGKKVLMIIHNS